MDIIDFVFPLKVPFSWNPESTSYGGGDFHGDGSVKGIRDIFISPLFIIRRQEKIVFQAYTTSCMTWSP
jgi:hypothetical protein